MPTEFIIWIIGWTIIFIIAPHVKLPGKKSFAEKYTRKKSLNEQLKLTALMLVAMFIILFGMFSLASI